MNASADVEPDQPDDACSIPSQLLTVEMLRRPLESTLHASVAVMHEVGDVGPGMKRLLQGVQRQVASKRVRHTPAYDLARENVRDERHVHEADPRRHVGQVRDPELVRALGRKAPLDEIRRPRGCLIDDRGLLVLPAADRTPEAHLAHQTLHRTPRHADSLPTQLPPDLPSPVHPEVLLPDPLDRLTQLGLSNGSIGSSGRIYLTGLLLVVRRRGDRQLPADRLDPVLLTVLIDERHHHFGRRSSSA